MIENQPVKMVLITGFLGSGKSTFLNHLLDQLTQSNQRIGVIVNEFGEIGFDGKLIKIQGIEIKELNNGQVFCGCLAGRFVTTIAAFAKLPLDVLLVETSGLANPQTLSGLIQDVQRLVGDRIEYQGMACLIDPVDFFTLFDTLNAYKEQIIKSRFIVINKIDLVEESILEKVEAKVRKINPVAVIARTSFAAVDFDLFALSDRQLRMDESNQVEASCTFQRPESFLLITKEQLLMEQVASFVREIADDVFRIKGFIQSEQGWMYLDVVRGDIHWKPLDTPSGQTEIVMIAREPGRLRAKIETAWKSRLGIPMTLR